MFPVYNPWRNIGLIKQIYGNLEPIFPLLPRAVKRYIYWKISWFQVLQLYFEFLERMFTIKQMNAQMEKTKKRKNKKAVWNMSKVNNKDTLNDVIGFINFIDFEWHRWFWRYFKPLYMASVVDFKQVNVCWVKIIFFYWK